MRHRKERCPLGRRGDPPAWGLGEGLTIPHRKKNTSYKILHRVSDLDFLERLGNGKWLGAGARIIILERILGKLGGEVWARSIWLRI